MTLTNRCVDVFEHHFQVSFMRMMRLREVARMTARIALEFAPEFVYVSSEEIMTLKDVDGKRNWPPPRFEAGTNNNNKREPDLHAIIAAEQLNHFFPQIVTQVTNNVNNANNGNGGNGGGGNGNGGNNKCTFKAFQSCNPKEYDGKGARGREAAMAMTWNDFKALMVEEFAKFHELAKLVPHLVTPKSSCIKRYIAGLAPEIRGMLQVTQPTTIQNAYCGWNTYWKENSQCMVTLTKGNDKRKVVEESGKSGGSWKENKKTKVGTGFVATTPPKNEIAITQI
ncbi:hypothetical protein Tco_0940047 [Tanacetum coccineum]|uniref:Reverse transcriptase domain-containing protein n=1 Tax=Tanacetum coccineum TaxID=301880 RepID=A0ABQ5DMA3_9ASTR